MKDFLDRVASAPISWGICEVPGWGAMLPTPRVLSEMAALGMPATELGAPGFLPTDPGDVQRQLAEYGMTLLGGFTPVVLHDPAMRDETIRQATATARLFQRAGASTFVSAVVMDPDWSEPRPLSVDEQRHMAEMFGVLDDICEEHGLQQVLHSHVMTLVETSDDVNRVLDSCDVHWCLDTGHLAIGGVDPVAFAVEAFERVGHVHLKDVRLDMVPAVMSRDVTLMQATQGGLFTPLGEGDVDIAGVVQALEARGYQGWYVIEQDTAITDGLPAEGEGPVDQVRLSLDYLRDAVAPTLASA
ncbi:MAG: TIM barrel protein [Actinobacteria bacterium]|jgi:inosose dehydratase|nr:TIM barrel protein [Actinomycetota bacterium]